MLTHNVKLRKGTVCKGGVFVCKKKSRGLFLRFVHVAINQPHDIAVYAHAFTLSLLF